MASDDEGTPAVRIEDDGSHVVVWIDGDLDVANANSVERAITAAMDRLPETHLIVDLSGIDFVDSAGLRVLVNVAERHGVRFRAPPDRLRRLFELTGLQGMLGP